MEQAEFLCRCAPPLTDWYLRCGRDLPWRHTRDPYRVWVSEIMLQQTRVEAVKTYYARFLDAFPDVSALASASEEQVLKLWEGLGYYSRARALHRAAQQIASAGFPTTHDGLLTLPGVGPYTAAAVGSICFDLPTPAVDGNVLRLGCRLLDDHRPLPSEQVRRDLTAWLTPAYERFSPGLLTQGLMELGATLCGPDKAPACESCPLGALCRARAAGDPGVLPCRTPKKQRRQEHRTVLLLRCGDRLAVRRRKNSGLLAGLWELPNVDGTLSAQEAAALAAEWGVEPTQVERMTERVHVFTHIEWQMRAYYLSCAREAPELYWAAPAELHDVIALPTAFRQFLDAPPGKSDFGL